MKPQHAAKIFTGPQGMNHWLVFMLAVLLFGLFVQWLWPTAGFALRWQADWAAAEYWRLLTGHFVHLSVLHAGMNMAALLLLWVLFLRDWRPRMDVVLMALSLPLTGLLLSFSQYSWYLGFSGVLHGWLLLGALRLWPAQRAFSIALIVALLVKLCWEPNNPAAAAEAELIGGPVAYVAHQAGVLAMILLFSCACLWDRVRR